MTFSLVGCCCLKFSLLHELSSTSTFINNNIGQGRGVALGQGLGGGGGATDDRFCERESKKKLVPHTTRGTNVNSFPSEGGHWSPSPGVPKS